jgi:hypothetical protein
MAFVFRIVPKLGPFKPLAYKPVTPEIEKLYMASVNATIDRYVKLLAEVRSDRLELPNTNFDVGDATEAGKYTLADAAYAKLLHKLNGHYAVMPTDLRVNILAYYHDLSVPISTRTNDGDWERLVSELAQLNAVSLDLANQHGEPAGRPVSDVSSGTGSSGQGSERVQ